MKFSILHISDLHRISKDNVECLLSSFEVEKDKYIEEGIALPSYIVVSGDVIQGSKKDILKNETDEEKCAQAYEEAKTEIKEQYDIAGKFLQRMAEIFLDKDKNRIIIVPGNHDVSQYVSRKCFKSLSIESNQDADKFENAVREFVTQMYDSNLLVRWSWKTMSFQKVTDESLYEQRFSDFVEFYNKFYEGKRSFQQVENEQSDIVEFPDDRVAFVCFNSCYHLDHLNESGYISPNALAKLTHRLLYLKRQGYLIIAVWHHHTNGRPKESNYLDNTILDNMVVNGVNIVLHGHQHISGIVNCYNDVFTENKLWLISAGTLYGNKNDVVVGNTRQYNNIEVEIEDRQCNVKIRSRVDDTMLSTTPIWKSEHIGRSKSDVFDIEIALNSQAVKSIDIKTAVNEIMRTAEKTGDLHKACLDLSSLDMSNGLVRSILLDYLQREDDDEGIHRYFNPPKNSAEAYAVLNIIEKKHDTELFKKFKESDYINNCKDPQIREMIDNLNIYLKH